MASLSKHGTELYRIEGATFKKAYMSDGTILKNHGHGWKLYAKVKPGHDVRAIANKAFENWKAQKTRRPALYAYIQLFKQIEPNLARRGHVETVLQLSGDDIDGAWADLDDWYETRGRYTFEDLQELYKARLAVSEEYARIKES